MGPPLSTGSDPEVLRDKKVRVVSAMWPLAPENIVCGQFRGYREKGSVASDSQVETFAALRLHIDTCSWRACHFIFAPANNCLSRSLRCWLPTSTKSRCWMMSTTFSPDHDSPGILARAPSEIKT